MSLFSENGLMISDLLERVKTLEEKVLKTSRKSDTTRAQQILLLKHLGILEHIDKLGLSKTKKAKLLSILLNASADNVEHDLTHIQSANAPTITKSNYEFLVKTFKETGLEELKKDCERILDNLERKG